MLISDDVGHGPPGPVPPDTPPPRSPLGLVYVFLIIVVLMFFSALAIWGVTAATIVAVSAAVVTVLRVILPKL